MSRSTSAGASLDRAVSLLQTFADATRMRLLGLLADEHELTVAELTSITGLAQSRVSTHLGRLKTDGLVRDRRVGASAFYALSGAAMPPRARELWALLSGSLADRVLEGDLRRRDELLRGRAGSPGEASAEAVERHYTPGRSWDSTLAGLFGLVELGEVLDVGAGDGAVTALYTARARRVTLLDKSERFLDAARLRLGHFTNVAFVQGDMHRLPFAAQSFDHVLLLHALAHSSEPHVAVAEAARVLRPGGRLSLVALAEHEERAVALSYGHENQGFGAPALRDWARAARLDVEQMVALPRESRVPHFESVCVTAKKPLAPGPRRV
ncbi:MAG TPA: metalloregulator ArsR/SmtB family transcription factor [Polyangiaceae bacterium]|nr:metalloregulator ArsR/SmtB family transcription factor [Polyangiaceae bacterium]